MGEVGFAKNSQYRNDNVELYLSPAPPKWHNDKEIHPLLCLQDLANLEEPPYPRTFQNKTCLYPSSWRLYTAQMMHLTPLSICIWKTPGSLSFEINEFYLIPHKWMFFLLQQPRWNNLNCLVHFICHRNNICKNTEAIQAEADHWEEGRG